MSRALKRSLSLAALLINIPIVIVQAMLGPKVGTTWVSGFVVRREARRRAYHVAYQGVRAHGG